MPSPRALVTGATGGIGLEIARALAADGAHVILPVRDRDRGEAAARSIRQSVPEAALEICDLDLADFGTITAVGAKLRESNAPIDLFVMNAGIVLLGDRTRHVTADGHELHLQTNFLGHAVLTRELMPLLVAAHARVAVQVSVAATRGRLDDLEGERRYSAWRAYAGSKRALGLWALELARRSEGITVNLCHPGVAPATHIAPALRSRLPGGEERWLRRMPGNSPAQGALPALMALERDAAPGCFFLPGGWFGLAGAPRERPLFRSLHDPAAGRRMWELATDIGR
ncbi:SDR family NAD(P)-dependent oxidoreductase [Microbacterium sp. KUDC0406]|uniref:SDR family NAD(P)-dependent oxidoreductase n=1 Tax=Microbacterium sp. KUDC0406 TaxID=2909588 RepID=UPI001F2AEC96|nr:SDR family NAD(P)-dependent oxidoreductase [Microbacterium sp. KUDC0406]UJP09396.1 SDR family NAD(P)-dependent oxidoreductase [Microbacterium sp. KUDC0406]